VTDLRATKSLLRQYHVRPNKLRGQNFLVNDRVAVRIVAAADIRSDETVLEIGPGLGILTAILLEHARRVVAVEIDRRLCDILRETLGQNDRLEVINDDILKLDLTVLAGQAKPGGLRIVSNLPFQVTGATVRMILDHLQQMRGATLTLQREVADRIVAGPGGKDFGALSVAAQYHSVIRRHFRISKTAFYPRPQVDSTVLSLLPREKPPVEVRDEALFFQTVGALFGHRRKTVRNALRLDPGLEPDDSQLNELALRTGLDLGRRGETMSLAELATIANVLGEWHHAHPSQ
jgi:16S rRNA (adenine1518-N6/adenine1519-N6)-dimethyltransferase